MYIINSDVYNSIRGAKRLLYKRFEDYYTYRFNNYSKYAKVYFWTNENINAYLNLALNESRENDNALTVLSSGDHTFNLISNGIMNIDTFDSNKLTEYIALGLKRAMILKCDYKEFNIYIDKLYNNKVQNIEETYELLRSLYPYMERSHTIFWEALINYDYKLRKNCNKSWYNLIELLIMNDTDLHINIFNKYLLNEENYNNLRERLINANISFKHANAKNLNKEFNKKYDYILLSNILDYFDYIFCDSWSYEYLKNYEEKLEELCSDNAVIFLKYAFFYKEAGEEDQKTSKRLFRSSFFYLSCMSDEEIYEIDRPFSDAKDAIVLKKVMK